MKTLPLRSTRLAVLAMLEVRRVLCLIVCAAFVRRVVPCCGWVAGWVGGWVLLGAVAGAASYYYAAARCDVMTIKHAKSDREADRKKIDIWSDRTANARPCCAVCCAVLLSSFAMVGLFSCAELDRAALAYALVRSCLFACTRGTHARYARARAGKPSNGGDADAEGGWSDTELELPPEVSTPAGGGGGGAAGAGGFVAAAVGQPDDYYWTSSATTVAEHVAAGSFEAALYMLDRQIGLGNAAPLKPLFMRLYAASRGSLTLAPGMPPFAASITRGFECTTGKASAPTNPLQMAGLVTRLQAAYKLTTGGKFPEALISFREILLAIPLVHATTQQEAVDAREMRAIGAQYVTGLELYLARKEAKDDVKRALELVAYFTHCRLEQQHARLALDAAMKAAYKAKNFVMAGSFARRLLDLAPPADVADMARKIVSACDKTPTNAEACNYDERNPFVVCCGSFTPIYAGSPQIKCSYCQVAYQPDFRNSTCRICSIGRVGAEGSGLPLSRK